MGKIIKENCFTSCVGYTNKKSTYPDIFVEYSVVVGNCWGKLKKAKVHVSEGST